jgi:hypothetical protein
VTAPVRRKTVAAGWFHANLPRPGDGRKGSVPARRGPGWARASIRVLPESQRAAGASRGQTSPGWPGRPPRALSAVVEARNGVPGRGPGFPGDALVVDPAPPMRPGPNATAREGKNAGLHASAAFNVGERGPSHKGTTEGRPMVVFLWESGSAPSTGSRCQWGTGATRTSATWAANAAGRRKRRRAAEGYVTVRTRHPGSDQLYTPLHKPLAARGGSPADTWLADISDGPGQVSGN